MDVEEDAIGPLIVWLLVVGGVLFECGEIAVSFQ